jgi:hypothetical protein
LSNSCLGEVSRPAAPPSGRAAERSFWESRAYAARTDRRLLGHQVFDTTIVNIAFPTAQHALSFSDAGVTLCGDVSVPFITMPDNEGVFEGNDNLATASKTMLGDIANFSPLLKSLCAEWPSSSKANRPQLQQRKPKFKRCVLPMRQSKEESK